MKTTTNKRPSPSTQRTTSSKSEKPITLANAQQSGYQFQMLAPVLLLGLGTQGSQTVFGIMQLLLQAVGSLPKSVNYLMLDAAAPRPGTRLRHHVQLGNNGCGSDPREGRRLFSKHYEQVLTAVEQMAKSLMSADPLVPCLKSVRELLTIWVFAGNGGSSGGFQQAAVDLCHHAGRRLGVRRLRVNVCFLGAEMALRDLTRQVTPEQQHIVRQSAAANLAYMLEHHHSNGQLTISPPFGTPFSIRASDRIWRLDVLDQSNGVHQCDTVKEMIDMTALHYAGALFTHSGIVAEDRYCDHDQLGGTGRGVF